MDDADSSDADRSNTYTYRKLNTFFIYRHNLRLTIR